MARRAVLARVGEVLKSDFDALLSLSFPLDSSKFAVHRTGHCEPRLRQCRSKLDTHMLPARSHLGAFGDLHPVTCCKGGRHSLQRFHAAAHFVSQ
jgi:hypothetical protein